MPLESGHAFLVAHIPKLDFLVLRAAQKQILMTRVVEKAQRSYGSSVLAEGLLEFLRFEIVDLDGSTGVTCDNLGIFLVKSHRINLRVLGFPLHYVERFDHIYSSENDLVLVVPSGNDTGRFAAQIGAFYRCIIRNIKSILAKLTRAQKLNLQRFFVCFAIPFSFPLFKFFILN